MTASAYGYAKATATGVAVTDGGTVAVNFALTPVPSVRVSGTVTDGTGHGWPVYAKLTVDGVMTQAVLTVGPDRPARDAAQLMLDHQIGALPVEEGGRLVGIVTETDLLRAFIRMEAPV